MGSPSYQVDIVNAVYRMQNVLNNKQATDATAGSVASDLATLEYTYSTQVLDEDAADIQTIADEGNASGWDDEYTTMYNAASLVYQNDAAVCSVGQNNATTSVEQEQTQVSQDSTNLSNVLTLSNILVDIGQYMIGILDQPYA